MLLVRDCLGVMNMQSKSRFPSNGASGPLGRNRGGRNIQKILDNERLYRYSSAAVLTISIIHPLQVALPCSQTPRNFSTCLMHLLMETFSTARTAPSDVSPKNAGPSAVRQDGERHQEARPAHRAGRRKIKTLSRTGR